MVFWKKKVEEKQSKVGSLISISKLGQPVWTPRDFESFAKEGYARNVVAYRCIVMISQAVASVKWELFEGERKIEDHPLYGLLARPNPYQSGSEFMEALASYKLIAGNAYIEAAYPGTSNVLKNTPPSYLYNLRPDRIKIIAGPIGEPMAYRYTVNGQHKDFPVSRNGKSNIMHLRSFNPIDDWYGMADTEAAGYSIDQHNESSKWNQSLLQNSAVPSGAIVAAGALSEDNRAFLKEQIDERYSSSRNAGRPILLEAGLDFKQMGTSPKDMDWLEGRREAAREIALAYGVPPMLLGIPGDNTYSNQREARLALWEETILPLLDSIAASFNYWLLPRYEKSDARRLNLTYDREGISALTLRRELQRNSLDEASFLTINEKREMMGLPPQEGGDVLYIEVGKVPLGMEVDVSTQSAEEAMVKSLDDIGFDKNEIKEIITKNVLLESDHKELG